MKKFNSIIRTLCLVALLCLTSGNAFAYKIYGSDDYHFPNIEANLTRMGSDKILVVTKDATVDLCHVDEGYALVILPGATVKVTKTFFNEGTIYVFGMLTCNGAANSNNNGTINIVGRYSGIFDGWGTINEFFNPFQLVPAKAPTSTEYGWKEYWETKIDCGDDVYPMYYEDESRTKQINNIDTWKKGDGMLTYNTPTKIVGQQPNAEHNFVGWKDYYHQVCTTSTGENYTFYAEDEAFTKTIPDLEAWKTGDGMLSGAEIGKQLYILEKQNGEFVYNGDLTFKDKEAYKTKFDFTVTGGITYSRTFTNTNWQALYVPFAISYGEWEGKFEVAAINNFHEYTDENGKTTKTELEVRLVKNGSLKPNHPYLIRANKADEINPQMIILPTKKISKSDAKSIDCSSTEWKYTFTGTYNELTNLYTNDYIFMSGGTLCKANNNDVALSPQRWYMTMESRGSQVIDEGGGADAKARQFDIKLLDGDATGIEEITVTRTPLQNGGKALYNLSGMRVSDTYKGIVIINGKKYIR